MVQNRVSQAEPRLPDAVRALGLTTLKSSPDLMMVVHLLSPDGRYDATYLRNYAVLNVKDRLASIDGVGDVQLFGSGDYAMRVWLDPQKMAEHGLSADDVVAAVRAQNVQAAAGVIGGSPTVPGLSLQLSVNAQGRLQSTEEFDNIVVKTSDDGAVTRLATFHASSWAPPITLFALCSATRRLSRYRSSSLRAPTRSRSPTTFAG